MQLKEALAPISDYSHVIKLLLHDGAFAAFFLFLFFVLILFRALLVVNEKFKLSF